LKLNATLENLGQLGESLERETARYLFPLALSAYQMGKPVFFGLLTVTQEGLFYESNRLLWSEVKMKISEYHDHIVIKKHGKLFCWASVKLSDVPNVQVFKMLLHHIIPHLVWVQCYVS